MLIFSMACVTCWALGFGVADSLATREVNEIVKVKRGREIERG